MKPLNLTKVSKEQLRQYFLQTWALDQKLFQGVSDKALYIKYQPLRHPLIFYFGHTAVVMLNKMNMMGMAQRINPGYEAMFAVGVDEMDWDDLSSQHYNWPTRTEVQSYRDQVKEVVLTYINQKFVDGSQIAWQDQSWIIVLGIEHQKIHVQTSSVLIRTVDLAEVKPVSTFPVCGVARNNPEDVPQNQLLPVEGISREWTKQVRGTKAYGWDCDFGFHHLQCKKYRASKYLVSNAQFLPFVREGGYSKPEYWEPEGREWLKSRRKDHPFFWVKVGDSFRYRCIFQEIDMPWDWPVDVNFHEAKAFCNWKSKAQGVKLRLPSEDEWYALRDLYKHDIFDWEAGEAGNINLEHFASACPVDMFHHAEGFYDIVGNVWQWCETPVYPFDKYQVHPVYQDFSSPTFDERHNLILGGSFISQGNLAMKEARYAFRRHFYQHAGFRYVESSEPVRKSPNKEYETDQVANSYLEFHYGIERYFGVPNFPKACVDLSIALNEKHGVGWSKAADLGCAVGRSTFELASRFDWVDGIDLSVRFFQLGLKLMQRKQLHYKVATEGFLSERRTIKMSQLGLQSYKYKVDFKQQDATILDINKFHSYDLIFCGNLIDRMARPKVFLANIANYLKPGGLLIITSPYTWLANWTKPSEWIGGFEDETGQVTTLQGLRRALCARFDLVGEPIDVPFVIRETARKYQHSLSSLTCWKLVR